nr:DNA mismatch repair protein Msh6 [Ciona intestinalis]XP_018666811.1 DNA mismatch repair protein Msh6 [Ciona intestinalis]|eukprot:XP_002126574.3 DNA mismatch repair protein Msh6 [Ciona intestinalis]
MPKNLFNYFVKSPSAKQKKHENVKTDNCPSVKPLHESNKSASPSTTNKKAKSKQQQSEFEEGAIVWAQVEGYPWWPAIVCKHPALLCHTKKKRDVVSEVHVQFYEDVPSRAWVKAHQAKKYNGSTTPMFRSGGMFHSNDPGVIKAVAIADKALKDTREERLKCVLDIPSDEDEQMDDHEADDENTEKDAGGSDDARHKSRDKKRRRIMEESDFSDEDGDFKPPPDVEGDEEDDESSGVDESTLSDQEEEEPVEIGKKRKRSPLPVKTPSTPLTPRTPMTPRNPMTPRTPASVSKETKSKLSLFQADPDSSVMEEKQKYLHETLDFLHPSKIKDTQGRKPDDPLYDKSSLKIPNDFMTKLTPAMHQWWKLKSTNFNVVLFFKVGKFYELYHMDAVVGVKELGLTYMKGNFAHSGFPEVAFGRYADTLVQKGYTVARVEQTETPEQNQQRIRGKSLPKHEKTLRREICRVTTKGTQVHNMWQGGSKHHESDFLLSISERVVNRNESSGSVCREFGVCFVDTTVGVFHLGQFTDDRHCSRLCTMLAHHSPSQVLFERGKLSNELNKILRTGLSSILQNPLVPGSQFWDAPKTLKTLLNEKYFVKENDNVWPPTLKCMLSDTDALGLSPKLGYELALSALGACVYYLKKCLIDYEILSMRQFHIYNATVEKTADVKVKDNFATGNEKMILDSVTLSNLEIIYNSKGEREGTLLERLDNCRTPFGKRLLKQWLCLPPCNPDVINDRLDAVDDIMSNNDLLSPLFSSMRKMPDLERMLSNIHSLSKGARKEDHPENRAIFYEETKYSKKKIEDFISVLDNYEAAFVSIKKMQGSVASFKSSLLKSVLGLTSGISEGKFPDLGSTLKQWKNAFNQKKAKETGKITPNAGTNPEYDGAMEDINRINDDLERYLNEQKKKLSCSRIIYKGTGNKRYQLELPADVASRKLPNDYVISGQRKGFKSFRTPKVDCLLKEMEDAETRRDTAQADTMSIVFREFDKDFEMWNTAVSCLALLDVLSSFAEYSKGDKDEMSRPIILPPSSQHQPLLEIRSARHPCITKIIFSDDFIPNDTILGCGDEGEDHPMCLLLTGPNMGGKSTLMRQVGLVVILAQLGCYVPAESCRMTPCDRIFTRLGASDRIMTGESTFYVELSETYSILKHATKNSLVLLDELGRGTATYDGTSIAYAVLDNIANHVGCRTIFSTHYHTLVEDLAHSKHVKLGHMSCMVEHDDVDGDVDKETLTFLYKLADGACPKSYGFHAALLADIPESVVTIARRKAKEMEENNKNLSLFRSLFSQTNINSSFISSKQQEIKC